MLSKIRSFLKPFFGPTSLEHISLRQSRLILNMHTGQSIAGRFRKMMSANHPDYGGSEYLCKKINESRILMEEQRRWL